MILYRPETSSFVSFQGPVSMMLLSRSVSLVFTTKTPKNVNPLAENLRQKDNFSNNLV